MSNKRPHFPLLLPSAAQAAIVPLEEKGPSLVSHSSFPRGKVRGEEQYRRERRRGVEKEGVHFAEA